jgi:hypothetical protein
MPHGPAGACGDGPKGPLLGAYRVARGAQHAVRLPGACLAALPVYNLIFNSILYSIYANAKKQHLVKKKEIIRAAPVFPPACWYGLRSKKFAPRSWWSCSATGPTSCAIIQAKSGDIGSF